MIYTRIVIKRLLSMTQLNVTRRKKCKYYAIYRNMLLRTRSDRVGNRNQKSSGAFMHIDTKLSPKNVKVVLNWRRHPTIDAKILPFSVADVSPSLRTYSLVSSHYFFCYPSNRVDADTTNPERNSQSVRSRNCRALFSFALFFHFLLSLREIKNR